MENLRFPDIPEIYGKSTEISKKYMEFNIPKIFGIPIIPKIYENI